MTFVVFGVTGQTGRVVAESLLGHGKAVRVVVRDGAKGEAWRGNGAEVASADLCDRDSTLAALRGAQAAYVLMPPNPTAPSLRAHQARVLDALAPAIAESGLSHVVVLSSLGAQHASGTGPIVGLHEMEQRLRAGRVAATFVRAASFMENLAGSLSMVSQGVLPTFFEPSAPIEMIASKDIGRFAARLLVEGPPSGHATVELSGPRAYSAEDTAQSIARIVGKPIRVEQLPTSAMPSMLKSFGFSDDMAALYREMTDAVNSKHVGFEGGDARRASGTTELEDVLRALLGVGRE